MSRAARLGRIVPLLVAWSAISTVAVDALAAEPALADAQLRGFLSQHCTICHGPETHERGLRLDQLPIEFTPGDTATQWIKVLEKLSHREMPPKDETQPTAQELQRITAGLQQKLHAASLAKQQLDGRVVLRRLNRTQYETALRDLLGSAVEVKELLPEDNVAAGFDNVSAVLDVSSVHLLRYQDAAEKALATVIPTRPIVPFKERRTGREIAEKQKLFADLLGKVAKIDGDTLLLYVRPYSHIPVATPVANQTGRYRVRASVYAVGTGGKPLPVLCSCRQDYGRDDSDVRAVHDLLGGKPTVIDGEFDIKQRHVINFTGWTLPSMREAQNRKLSLDGYTGPGLAIEWIEIEGPLDAWPPAGYQRLFEGVPLKPKSHARAESEGRPAPAAPQRDSWWLYDPLVVASAHPREDAERLMKSFLPMAFRRPVSEELQLYYVQIVHTALDAGTPFPDAMLLGYKAALCSPHFLYLTEQPRGAAKQEAKQQEALRRNVTRLDDYAVASRLSYFLWSSLPDTELTALAAKGELSKPAVLRSQVERMLQDSKAHRFTTNFAGQWLDLKNINATSPDPQIYGEFNDFLFWSMPRETELFFEEVLRQDLSLIDFVHSNWTFLNERLAQHYDIAGVFGGELRKVQLPAGCHRGGVLTQASIMKVTADGTRTSPVLRGKWVLDRILGQPPSPPPPDVPGIDPDIRGATTIRQQLDKHRNTPACNSCHKHIDPPGFALESFDPIGGWRDFYRGTRGNQVELVNYPGRKIFRGLEVEQGGQTPDGRPFADIDGYKQFLLSDRDQLARNLVQKLIVFATGADIQFADREVVEQLVAQSRAKNYGFRSLIHDVVQSRVFLSK